MGLALMGTRCYFRAAWRFQSRSAYSRFCVRTVVERIRKQFENNKVIVGNATIAATASFGIAGFRGTKPPDLDALVARADTAMYAAKHNGRNRMEFEPDPAFEVSWREAKRTILAQAF